MWFDTECNDFNSVKILVEARAQILQNDGGWSPIDIAHLEGCDPITELLQNYEFEIKEPEGD